MCRAKLHSWCSDASTFKPPFWAGVQTTNSPLPYSSWEPFRGAHDCCRLRRNSVCSIQDMQQDISHHATTCAGARWCTGGRVEAQRNTSNGNRRPSIGLFIYPSFNVYLCLSLALLCSLLMKQFRRHLSPVGSKVKVGVKLETLMKKVRISSPQWRDAVKLAEAARAFYPGAIKDWNPTNNPLFSSPGKQYPRDRGEGLCWPPRITQLSR